MMKSKPFEFALKVMPNMVDRVDEEGEDYIERSPPRLIKKQCDSIMENNFKSISNEA
jgi:hypothetical protein